jgi:hypothetical protein
MSWTEPLGRAGPEGEAVGSHDGLDVTAVMVSLAGVPGVELLAFYAGQRLGAAIGLEDLAVQDHVGHAFGHGPLQGVGQARGLRGQDVDGFGDVTVGGRAGHAVVAAEGLDPGPVTEPAQCEFRLLTAGQLPALGGGGAAAALGGQQARQVAKQSRGDVEHGSIGDQVESWG